MKTTQGILHTVWQGQDLLVLRDTSEIDRLHGPEIERVVLVYQGRGDTPGDLVWALIELPEHHVILPAQSGIAGRVHFERQAWWAERRCIYWVGESQVSLPRRLRPGVWLLRRQRPGYMRVPRTELAGLVDGWPLEGPQTWDQRKWKRITEARLLAPAVQNPNPPRRTKG